MISKFSENAKDVFYGGKHEICDFKSINEQNEVFIITGFEKKSSNQLILHEKFTRNFLALQPSLIL